MTSRNRSVPYATNACLQTHMPADTNKQAKKMGLQPGRNGWRTCVHLTAADWLRRVKARLTYFLEETGDEGVGGGEKGTGARQEELSLPPIQ